MRLIRRNGELVTFGTLRAWEMLLEGPEKKAFWNFGLRFYRAVRQRFEIRIPDRKSWGDKLRPRALQGPNVIVPL